MSGAQAKQPHTRAMKHDPFCSMPNCGRAYYAKGFCRLHWERNYNGGSPESRLSLRNEDVETRLRHYTRREGDCLVWVGRRNKDGYGQITVEGKSMLAHRMAYMIWSGPIAAGQVVRHRCDNPPCIDPAHLELGAPIDNSRDMVQRGRSTYGSRNASARLNETAVAAIRSALDAGQPQRAIAREFGCGQSTVSRIARGASWTRKAGA